MAKYKRSAGSIDATHGIKMNRINNTFPVSSCRFKIDMFGHMRISLSIDGNRLRPCPQRRCDLINGKVVRVNYEMREVNKGDLL
jgi:hypothetical protein